MSDDLNPLYKRIDSINEADLDTLPHGAIQLDANGRVLQFNRYESELANMPKSSVIGKDFFKEVAPCTDVKEFRGEFEKGVAAQKLYVKFRYHFAFKQNPRNVLVTLFWSEKSKSVWVFVQPQD